MKKLVSAIFISSLLLSSASFYAENKASAQLGNELTIDSQRIEMHISENYVEMTGNVIVQDENMTMTADKIIVYLSSDNEKDGEGVEKTGLNKIVAEGKVSIRKLNGDESATGDHGLYDAKTNSITLDGNCTLMSGDRILQCKQITYNMTTQIITSQGGTLFIPNLKKNLKKEEQPETQEHLQDGQVKQE